MEPLETPDGAKESFQVHWHTGENSACNEKQHPVETSHILMEPEAKRVRWPTVV